MKGIKQEGIKKCFGNGQCSNWVVVGEEGVVT
jgi:hypothetical protein